MWDSPWLTTMFVDWDVEGACLLYISAIHFITCKPSSLSIKLWRFYMLGIVVVEMFSRLKSCWKCAKSSWILMNFSCGMEFFCVSTCIRCEGKGILVVVSMLKAPLYILWVGALEIPRSRMKVLLWEAMSLELRLTKVLLMGHQTLIKVPQNMGWMQMQNKNNKMLMTKIL